MIDDFHPMGPDTLPRISVILPVFNGRRYLKACVHSVLCQTLTNFELLIGDDASTDGSREILQGFSDPRIRIFLQGKTVGLFGNLNHLLKKARAPLVRILGQDDLLEPNCLEREVSFFSLHPEIGMSFCKSLIINEQGNESARAALRDLPEVVLPALSVQLFFYHGCIPGSLSTVCVRKECFEELGGFNEQFRLAGDYEMWVRICCQKGLGVLHEHLVRLRSHPNQLSRLVESRVPFILETRRIRSKILPLLPKGTRSQAVIYSRLRQGVLETHCGIRCLLSGKVRDFFRILCVMGFRDFAWGLCGWLLTVNNHLYRPRPRFTPDGS